MEGAVMQARGAGSLAPFDAAVAELRHYFGLMGRDWREGKRVAAHPPRRRKGKR
jgi:hypothetical protein